MEFPPDLGLFLGASTYPNIGFQDDSSSDGRPLGGRVTRLKTHSFVAMGFLIPLAVLFGQQDRIAGRIGGRETVVLSGNMHPKAQPQYDEGRVDPDLKMNLVTLAFKPSAQQQAALDQLLEEQQDPLSPNYHHWLTPEQYADRFGLSESDMDKIVLWLESQGFTVERAARGRNWISFNGGAREIETAFHTDIHRYRVDDELHFANSNEPSVPVDLAGVVLGIRGLDDFRPKPPRFRRKDASILRRSTLESPDFTKSNGTHVLLPDDIATIYDIVPLYAEHIDGSGQRIVVVGQSNINLADIATFRSGILSANVPQVKLVPGSVDPGITPDMGEADLDIEWVGAVARNATIIYVYSTGAFLSAQYAIDENLAPVVSMSFGVCEAMESPAMLNSERSLAQQANAQGITWVAASGDSGAAACDTGSQATRGIGVLLPASISEVTAVGGTEFNEANGNYWSNTNSSIGASALSYIPEIAWNDTASAGALSASGGGMSTFYPKPAWQTGPGVPNDGARDVPDVSMTASANHDSYIIESGGQAIRFVGDHLKT